MPNHWRVSDNLSDVLWCGKSIEIILAILIFRTPIYIAYIYRKSRWNAGRFARYNVTSKVFTKLVQVPKKNIRWKRVPRVLGPSLYWRCRSSWKGQKVREIHRIWNVEKLEGRKNTTWITDVFSYTGWVIRKGSFLKAK